MKKLFTLLLLLLIYAEIIVLNNNLYSQVTQQWIARYNGTYNLDDVPVGIAIDKLGNSYITGYSFTTGNKAVATIKYNPQGVYQWVKIFQDVSQIENFPKCIATDTLGNTYVAGYSGNVNNLFYYTWLIKYNSAGDSQWVRKNYGTASFCMPTAMKTDKQGNIYLTGRETEQIMFTVKYNTNGDTLWKRTQIESGYAGNWPYSIALDSLGNVYTGGVSWFLMSAPYRFDFHVVKYNNDGVKQWSRTYGEVNYDEYSYSMGVDKNLSVYLTGTQYRPGTDNDFLTVKYNSSGTFQWAKTYNRNTVDKAYALTIDYANNIIVTGTSGMLGVGPHFCTIKYNTSGDSQWVRIYTDTGTTHYEEAYSIAVDSSNNIYVSGRNNNTGAATIKYSQNGIQMWKVIPPVGVQFAFGGIALDNLRNVFVVGANGQNGTNSDYLTVKYSQFVGIQSVNSDIPKEYNLYQNYPNPFNPTTKITASLGPSQGGKQDVKLIIYNVSGQEIAVFTPPLRGGREGLSPGTYEVEWDASAYPSGIYFYTLQTESFSQTKKMVLIK